MTASEAAAAVTERLVQAGYQLLGRRVTVSSIPYEFDGVLLGPDGTLDLVLVVEVGPIGDPPRLRQKVEGLCRALDMARSRRSITTVLVGQPLPAALQAALQDVTRCLSVADVNSEPLDDRLAILLPFDLPISAQAPVDPLGTLRQRLNLAMNDPRRELIAAAPDGAGAVEAVLARIVENSLADEGTSR